MEKVDVVFENCALWIDQYNPEYKTAFSSGVDLRADIKDPIVMRGGGLSSKVAVPTGLKILLPEIPVKESVIDAQIRSRSGLAYKHGLFVLTGTIDNDYTGELKVILGRISSLGDPDFIIEPGDRIAQLVLGIRPIFEYVEGRISDEDKKTRGSAGFGSTGVK